MIFRPAAIMAALDAQEMTWAIVVLILSAMVTVAVTAWRLSNVRNSADAKRAVDVSDQLATERHNALLGNLGEIKRDVHELNKSVEDLKPLKPRVERLEGAVFSAKGDRS